MRSVCKQKYLLNNDIHDLLSRYNERHARRLDEQRKELELEKAKLKVREAKIATQRNGKCLSYIYQLYSAIQGNDK